MSNALQPINVIEGALTQLEPEFSRIAVSHGWGLVAKSQILAAKRQLMKSDYSMGIAARNPDSVIESVKTAGILGIDLTEGKRQGWLVPREIGKFNNQKVYGIAFQIGYKGYEAIYQRLGVIDHLFVNIIHANDEFSWSGDDQEKPSHNADWFNKSARGEAIGAYCVTYLSSGGIQVVLSSVSDIYENHRDKSDSWKAKQNGDVSHRKYSPWANHTEEMIKKTMVYIASKQWPAASKDEEKASAVLERLHIAETADYSEYAGEQAKGLMLNDLHALMLANDALGVYLLQKGKDYEKITPLHWWPESPKGLKGACKENAERMKQDGMTLYQCIKDSIENDDEFRLAECIEAATAETKKWLAADLGEEATATIKSMLAKVKN